MPTAGAWTGKASDRVTELSYGCLNRRFTSARKNYAIAVRSAGFRDRGAAFGAPSRPLLLLPWIGPVAIDARRQLILHLPNALVDELAREVDVGAVLKTAVIWRRP
jgi:hypothetical protein